MRASDLIRIDINGNAKSHSDWKVNAAGFVIHAVIHQARSDLHCVMHTHEPISQAMCALDAKIIPVTQEGCQFYQRVDYHDFEGIVLDGSEGPKLVKAMGQDNHTLVLKNHGLLTAGASAAWAFVRHQAFIRNADVQLKAMAAGNLNLIPEHIMIHTRAQFEGGAAQANAKVRHPEWPALIRLVDQKDPTWKL